MDEYSVMVFYPYAFDNEDGEYRWSDAQYETIVEAKNEGAANAIVQKKIDAGEFDATLQIPAAAAGPNDIDLDIRPYILPDDTTKDGAGTLEGFV